jgi:hypothetical protein
VHRKVHRIPYPLFFQWFLCTVQAKKPCPACMEFAPGTDWPDPTDRIEAAGTAGAVTLPGPEADPGTEGGRQNPSLAPGNAAGRTLVPIERNAGRRRLMLSRPLAQNRHKTDGESVVFSWIYMRATKNLLAAQSVQNGIGRLLPS